VRGCAFAHRRRFVSRSRRRERIGRGVRAWHAGQVEAGPKELVIDPLGITFAGEDLQLR
jgi:hypothetical protein